MKAVSKSLIKILLASVLLLTSTAPIFGIDSPNGNFEISTFAEYSGSANSSFTGAIKDDIIIAGGYNLDGSVSDTISVLSHGSKISQIARFKTPLADGTSVVIGDSMLCIGGTDGHRRLSSVVKIKYNESKAEVSYLPDLPCLPLYCRAGFTKATLYAACLERTQDGKFANRFLALNLEDRDPKWKLLEIWPGPERTFFASASQNSAFYIFGGNALYDANMPVKSCFKYQPGKGWSQCADLPFAMNSPSAVDLGQSSIAMISRANAVTDANSVSEIMLYNTITDTLVSSGRKIFLSRPMLLNSGNQLMLMGSEKNRGSVFQKLIWNYKKAGFAVLDYATLLLYLALMVWMGFYFSRREKTTEDYFKGGRRVPWWAAGLSMFATGASAISLMGMPAKAYDTNWIYLGGMFLLLLTLPMLIFVYCPIIRRLNITTAYEYLEKRFGVSVRIVGSAIFIINEAFVRMGIVLLLPSLALSAVTGFDIYTCILVMGVLTTIYTALGGIEAVVWTDVVQSVLMLAAVIITLAVVSFNIGGYTVISTGNAAEKFKIVDTNLSLSSPTIWVYLIATVIGPILAGLPDQNVVQRILTTPTEKQAKRSLWVPLAVALPMNTMLFAVGTALYVFYKSHPERLNPVLVTDNVLPWFLSREMPAGFSGLVIAGIFSASMSTLSSINSISTVIVNDYYRRFKASATDRSCLKIAKLLTMALGCMAVLIAMLLATFNVRSLWDIFLQTSYLILGGFAGVGTLALFTKRANSTGALVGSVSGILIAWLVQHYTPLSFFLYNAVGMLSCIVVGYMVSILFPEKPRDLEGLTIYTLPRSIDTAESVRQPKTKVPV